MEGVKLCIRFAGRRPLTAYDLQWDLISLSNSRARPQIMKADQSQIDVMQLTTLPAQTVTKHDREDERDDGGGVGLLREGQNELLKTGWT